MRIKSFQKCILLVLLSSCVTIILYSIKLNSSNFNHPTNSNNLFITTPTEEDYQGFFYSEDGKYLGKKGSSEDIYITNAQTFEQLTHLDSIDTRMIYSLTEIANISHSDFLNRVNWTYGEGGGMAADFYASAINNMAMKLGEFKMYKHMNEGERNTAAGNIRKYFVDYNGPNKNYKNFIKYRDYILNSKKMPSSIAKQIDYCEHATKSNIRVLSGKVEDPTNGAVNKIGGLKAINYALLHNVEGQEIVVVKSINKLTNYTSYHVFFELGQKKNIATTEYTLITMENFQIIDRKTVSKEYKV